jgi:hypothetical protein
VFNFFPEIKSEINDLCGHPDNQPSTSAESVAAEIRQNILPKCYEDLLEEIDDVSDLPYFKLECQAHRWVQLTVEKAKELELSLNKLPLQQNVSYDYTTPEGVAMHEYHVDMHKKVCDYVSDGNRQYGGDLSI